MEFSQRVHLEGGPNITPLIDVVFILLIFFLLTSTFYVEEGIKVELPEASTATQLLNEITVAINGQGRVFLENEQVSLETLGSKAQTLIANSEHKKLSIRSDANVAVQMLVSVMDQLKQAGATEISVVAERK